MANELIIVVPKGVTYHRDPFLIFQNHPFTREIFNYMLRTDDVDNALRQVGPDPKGAVILLLADGLGKHARENRIRAFRNAGVPDDQIVVSYQLELPGPTIWKGKAYVQFAETVFRAAGWNPVGLVHV